MGICESGSNNEQNIKNNNANPSIQTNIPNGKYFSNNVLHNSDTLIINNNVIVSKSVESLENIYDKLKLLGKGAFGEVWHVKHKILGKDFALKIIKKRPNSDTKLILNEIDILKKLDHPNILKILDFHLTYEKYYIATEYCPEGDLHFEIDKKARFTEREASFILYQILLAIRYCHKMRVVHRDIKPENILIVSRDNTGLLYIKLIDFGSALIFGDTKNTNFVGSFYYIAPEVIKGIYDEACDLWSIGVIMYIMLVGTIPFNGNDKNSILKAVSSGKYDTISPAYNSLSDNAKDLITNLLKYKPEERITAEQALNHPWFKTEDIKKIDHLDDNIAKELLSNLEKYNSDNKIKCAVIAYLVHQNTNIKECIDASRLFNTIDTDHDGKITKEELKNAFIQYYNISEIEAINKTNYIFNIIDTDSNDMIENEEFIRACINPNIFASYNYLKVAFNYFDKNRDGKISITEMEEKFFQKSAQNPNAKKKLQNMFNEIDTNHDGFISFEEFSSLMK